MPQTSSVIHQEVILFTAPPEFIRTCITTPERIMDYYPSPLSAHVVEPNRSMICRGRSGVSLLEIVDQKTDAKGVAHIELSVMSALLWKQPYTAERVRQNSFFSMTEDWVLEPFGTGTRLIKTWRDLKKHKWSIIPMAYLVRKTAKGESKKIQTLWDKQFEQLSASQESMSIKE